MSGYGARQRLRQLEGPVSQAQLHQALQDTLPRWQQSPADATGLLHGLYQDLLAGVKKPSFLFAVLGWMQSQGVRNDAANIAYGIRACGWSKSWALALALECENYNMGLQSADPCARECSYVSDACARARQWSRALTLLPQQPRGRPRINTDLLACKHAAQWQRALSLLRGAFAASQQPGLVCYGMATDACRSAPAGEALFAEGLELGVYPADLLQGPRTLNLHYLSVWQAVHATKWFVKERAPAVLGAGAYRHDLHIVTGGGSRQKAWNNHDLKNAVASLLSSAGVMPAVDEDNDGRWVLTADDVRKFVRHYELTVDVDGG